MANEQQEQPTSDEAVGLIRVFELAGFEMPEDLRTTIMAMTPTAREALRERMPMWLDLYRIIDSGREPTEEDLEKLYRLADALGYRDLLD